jgi:TolB-like protein/Flp pilus assembly protein TadD
MSSFFGQLRQRRVYRVAIGYAIAAWLAVQIAATVLPAFHAPEFILPALIVLLGGGFPVALVLAWAFDVTATGIERTPATETAAKNLRYVWALAVIGLLMGGAGVGTYLLWHFPGEKRLSGLASPNAALQENAAEQERIVPDRSIAVLPFDNLSSDPDNAFFASGIQDEILTRLAKIGALRVISRASTQQYQSKPANLSAIGKQLGVANILEGSVQRAGNAVHINVQLIKAATQTHVWAEVYDRELDDIFRVEGEVATAIAEALKAEVTGNEKQAMIAGATNNSEAYNAYLRGVALYRKGDNKEAQQFLEESVRLDPNFATAWARLAQLQSLQFFSGHDATDARRKAARSALDTALQLQPDLAEVQLAQGYYQYWVERDYDGAARRFAELYAKWPNNADVLVPLGLIARRQGHWDQARSYLDQAVTLDPMSPDTRLNAADVFAWTRNFPAALRTLDEALNLWPDNLTFIADKALVCHQLGDLDRAEAVLKGVQPRAEILVSIIAIADQAEFRRKGYPEAIAQLEALRPSNETEGSASYLASFLNRNLGDLRRLAGDADGARNNYLQARDGLLGLLKSQPNNADIYDSLALVYCGLGDREAAIKASDRALVLMPVTKDALAGSFIESTRAQIDARFGDRDRAIPALARLLKLPGYFTPAILRLAPDFDPLRGDPRFEKLCEEKP